MISKVYFLWMNVNSFLTRIISVCFWPLTPAMHVLLPDRQYGIHGTAVITEQTEGKEMKGV